MNDWKSEQIADLCAALSAAQGAMDAVARTASAGMSGGKTRKYATLADCWEIAREPLKANGLALVQMPFTDEHGLLALRSVILHSSGQWIATEYVTPKVESDFMNAHQADGSAITYARRYALSAMLGIPQDDDDGQAASKPGAAPATPAASGEIPFGKRKGQRWTDQTIKDLEWYAGTDNPAMRDPARAELERRSSQKHSDADPAIPSELR